MMKFAGKHLACPRRPKGKWKILSTHDQSAAGFKFKAVCTACGLRRASEIGFVDLPPLKGD